MASSLQLVAVIKRMFESVVEVYLDIEDIVRFFMEQSGTQYRIRQLKSSCNRNLAAQRRYVIRVLSDYLPIKSIVTVKKQNSFPSDGCANFNAFRTLDLLEASQKCNIVHRLALAPDSMENEVQRCPFSCSTPINHRRNDEIPGESKTMEKIGALEEEIAKLRNQIASILRQTSQTSQTSDVSRGPQLPPPPPPPPPPLPPMCGTCFEGFALKQQIKMNKDGAGNKRNAQQRNGVQIPNMADVLKGMNKVKLRPIQRSPGGTPIKPKTNRNNEDDLNALLATALKNRLSRMIIEDSPQKNSGYSSGDNSMSSSREFSSVSW